jgi:hypothetical protein
MASHSLNLNGTPPENKATVGLFCRAFAHILEMKRAPLAAAIVLLSLWAIQPAAAQSGDDDDAFPVAPPPAIERPIIRPAPSSELGRGVALPAQPETAHPLQPPAIGSPVTGYGVGGMRAPPGAPPNPPYR